MSKIDKECQGYLSLYMFQNSSTATCLAIMHEIREAIVLSFVALDECSCDAFGNGVLADAFRFQSGGDINPANYMRKL